MRGAIPGIVLGLALAITGAAPGSGAQERATVRKVGRMAPSVPTDPWSKASFDAFRRGLQELGWIEGQNLAIEARWAGQDSGRFGELAADLARLKVEVIVVVGTAAVDAAKDATGTIPIVMSAHGDAVGSGLVASLARPGGNITGLSILLPELTGKRLELLREVVPRTSRIAVLANPTLSSAPVMWREAELAARTAGVELQNLEVRNAKDLDRAFTAMARMKAGGLLVFADSSVLERNRSEIIARVLKSRVPAMYPWRLYPDEGGLMSYGPSQLDIHRRAAAFVDKILKGAKPADLPVEQPTKFELVINMKAARALGLTIPQTILVRATEVIQ